MLSAIRKLVARKTKRKANGDIVSWMASNPAYASYDIGEWTYGMPSVRAWGEGASLKIGKFCSISEGVCILLGGEHRPDWVTTFPFNVLFSDASHFRGHPTTKGDVVIGNDVWICRKAMILSGVTIGSGAVIGAGAVVTKSVQPYEIVAGNPARHIRFRFPEQVRSALLEIGWWDWPIDNIREAMPLLLSQDIESFLSRYSGAKSPRPD